MVRKIGIIALLGSLALAVPAAAHTVWMVPEKGKIQSWHVLFGGHAGKTDAYPTAKLKTVKAVGSDGKALAIRRTNARDGVHLTFSGQPSVILAHYDNGIHTTRSDGPSVEKPMKEVPNAIKGVRATKYHKTIAAWTPAAIRTYGQPFEVVPLSAAQPFAGKPFSIRILIGGKPAAGIAIARNEEGRDAVTDAQGVARFIPVRGYNKLWAGQRLSIKGNPDFTEDSIEYSFGFFAK